MRNLLPETQEATLAARIDVATHSVADLDRRLSQIDLAIEEAAMRRRTNAALSAIDGQRKGRAALVEERKREAGASLQPCKPSALAWPRRAGKSRRKRHRLGTRTRLQIQQVIRRVNCRTASVAGSCRRWPSHSQQLRQGEGRPRNCRAGSVRQRKRVSGGSGAVTSVVLDG